MSLFSKGVLCKRCSTPFRIDGPRTPMLLNCGHNICESCAYSLLKTRREIPCPHCETITSQSGKPSVKDLPVDKYTLGSVVVQQKTSNLPSYSVKINFTSSQSESLFNASQDKCGDCENSCAIVNCVNCASNFCHYCFIKAHSNSTILGRHKVQPIENEREPSKSNVCEFHNEIVRFFCNDDDMKVCSRCLLSKGKHFAHDVIELAEKNKAALEEVVRESEHVKNMCTHLLIAEKKLKDYLPKVKTSSQNDANKIQDTFRLAHGLLQIRERTLETAVVNNVKSSETSINHLLEEIEATSKKLKGLLCDIESCKADKSLAKIDNVVNEMNSVKELPCCIEASMLHGNSCTLDIPIENESSVQFDETSLSHFKDFGTIVTLDDERWKLCAIKKGARPEGISEEELQIAEKNAVPACKMATMTAAAYMETHRAPVTEVIPAGKSTSTSTLSDNGSGKQFKRRHYFSGSSCGSELNNAPYIPVRTSPPQSPPRQKTWHYLQQERVILSHSNNPSNFWVRLTSTQHVFDSLHKQIEDYMFKNDEPCPEADVVKGQVYLARRGKDNRWCRVKVQDIMAASLVVKQSEGDKGDKIGKAAVENEEMDDRGDGDSDVTVEFNEALIEDRPPQEEPAQTTCESGLSVKVFHIDFGSSEMIPISGLYKIPQQFSQHAELAIHCTLAELEGIYGFWAPDANKFFECYCGDKILLMTAIHTSDMKVEVELGHVAQSGVNDTPGSVRESLVFVELAKFVCDSPKFLNHTIIKKYYYKADLPGLETSCNVNVRSVKSPEDMYVQQEGAEHVRFVKLMAEINTFYENLADVDDWIVYNPKIGMPCIAKCENDVWNRAVIEGLPGHLQLDIVFVDFGNSRRIMSNVARRMNSEFMNLPIHALHCGLVDIKPKSGSWSEEAKATLTQLVDSKVFRMSVIGISDEKLNVSLLQHIPEYKQVICLSSQLVKLGYAISSGNSAERMISAYKMALGITAKTNGNSSSVASHVPTDETRKSNDSGCPHDYIPVTVSFIKDPSEIYVQCDERKDQLEELVNKLQDRYNEGQSTVPSTYNWEIGQQCVVRNQFKWFRCTIKQMKFANLFEVWAMDFGHCIDATRENMRTIEEDFQEDCAFACKCHLANISPTGGSNKWPSSVVDYVKDRFSNDPEVFLRVAGPTVGDSEPVDLYVKKLHVGGPLEPTKVLYLSMCEAIVEAGLAIPLKKVKVEPGTEPVVAIPAVLQKQIKVESQKKAENWLGPVQPIRAHWKCTVIPTHVDEDGVIYLHDKAEYEQIDVITSAMNSKYENTTPEPDDMCWMKDDCCAAYLTRDCNWHRGRIVDVKPEGIEVFFIDYGYREILEVEHLRKKIFCTDIPQLSWPCKLFSIEPKTDDAMWPKTTLDFISEIIVNKCCEMEVWVPPKGTNFMEISLTLPLKGDLGQILNSNDYVFFHDADTDCVQEDMDISNDEDESTELEAFPELPLPPVGEVFPVVPIDTGASPDLVLMQRACMESPQTEYQRQAKEHYLYAAQMCETMNEKAPLWPVVEDVKPGTPCCTVYSHDGQWFRAIVKSIQENSTCLVLFVDYGNEEIVSMKDIKALPKDFLCFPRQYICCKLHQIVPTAEEGWTEDVMKKFTALWSDPPTSMLVAHVKVSRYPIEVDILYDENDDDRLAYQHLIDMGFVRQC